LADFQLRDRNWPLGRVKEMPLSLPASSGTIPKVILIQKYKF
jgi:hypothetical protein